MGFGSFGGGLGALGGAGAIGALSMSGMGGLALAGPFLQTGLQMYEAERMRDFQKESFKKRYQWTMEDMRRAGLNPILAYQQGGGNALPGAQANIPDPSGAVLPAINTAIKAKAVEQTIKKQEEEIRQTKAVTRNVKKDTELKEGQKANLWMDSILKAAQEKSTTAQAGVHSATAAKTQQDTINAKLEQFRREAIAEGAKSEKEIMETTVGKYLRWLDIIGRSINPFSSSRSTK